MDEINQVLPAAIQMAQLVFWIVAIKLMVMVAEVFQEGR